jgi:hypothetical protein
MRLPQTRRAGIELLWSVRPELALFGSRLCSLAGALNSSAAHPISRLA